MLPRFEKWQIGLHRGNCGVSGRWGGAHPPNPTAVFIHTFPLLLGRLPLAAVRQIVAVAGLAVTAILQHLHIALDVDEAPGLQFVQRPPRCGFRTSAGVGDGPDPRLARASASGAGTQIAVDRQFVGRQAVVKTVVLIWNFRSSEYCIVSSRLLGIISADCVDRITDV